MKIGSSIVVDNIPDDLPVYQIFTHSTSPFERVSTDEQLKELAKTGKNIYVHSTFNTVIGHFFGRKCFVPQYKLCKKFGFCGIVLHIPNIPIDEIVKGFKKIASPDTSDGAVTVYLEHVPGEYGASTKLLGKLYNSLVKKYPKYKFGICIDTCHIYSSGVDLGDVPTMTKYLANVEAIGASNILVHLNDSMGELGSLIDRHATIGTRIWTATNHSALRLLLAKDWDAIIELGDPDKIAKSITFINKIEKL